MFDSDLIIANGLGEKSLDLDNITVKGRLVVWGGSAVSVNGKSTVAGVVLPRNDGPVQVVFDAAATELSEKGCSIIKPNTMDRGNKVLFTDKADAPTIAFDLPAYLYVGDSAAVKTTLTDADAVTWELTRDGKSCDMPEGFTRDGGLFYFMEAGRYTLKGTVENSGGTGSCEKTVEVLPIGDIAFSLPEYGYTDRAEDVKLLTKNDLDGSVAWTLTRDGKDLSDDEFRELLLRRKEIYESLHPETKAGIAQAVGMNRAVGNNVADKMSATSKSFVDDTADKLGVDPRTVRRELQTAKNLTPEAKEIIKGAKVTKSDALKLSRLPPEQQAEAAALLIESKQHSAEGDALSPARSEPAEPEPPAEAPPPSVPYSSSGRHYASFEESIADLKNHDKDCSYTPDALLDKYNGGGAELPYRFKR